MLQSLLVCRYPPRLTHHLTALRTHTLTSTTSSAHRATFTAEAASSGQERSHGRCL